MWYHTSVVRQRVRQTAFPASSHLLGPTKKSANSSPCHTFPILIRNSFVCRTYKNKRVKVLCLPHIFQINVGAPLIVNQVPA
jgi:hypothetical protein